MSQHTLVIADSNGTTFLSALNAALAALGTLQKGPNPPASPQAGWIWIDDNTPSTTVWTISQYDGSHWIPLWYLDTTNNWFLPILGGTTRLFQSSTDTPGYGNALTGGSIEKNAQGAALFLSRSAFASLYLNVNGNDQVAAFQRSGITVGGIAVTTTTTTFQTTSDPEFKDRFERLTGARERIRKVRVWRHGWKAEPDGPLVDGVMAPEFRRLFPWAVTKRRRDRRTGQIITPMMVDYSKAVPATMAAVQEVDADLVDLRKVVKAQEREMRRQQRAIDKLTTLVGRLLK